MRTRPRSRSMTMLYDDAPRCSTIARRLRMKPRWRRTEITNGRLNEAAMTSAMTTRDDDLRWRSAMAIHDARGATTAHDATPMHQTTAIEQ